jgi:hypothetical protein
MHAYIHLCLQRNHINQALSGTLTDWVQFWWCKMQLLLSTWGPFQWNQDFFFCWIWL